MKPFRSPRKRSSSLSQIV